MMDTRMDRRDFVAALLKSAVVAGCVLPAGFGALLHKYPKLFRGVDWSADYNNGAWVLTEVGGNGDLRVLDAGFDAKGMIQVKLPATRPVPPAFDHKARRERWRNVEWYEDEPWMQENWRRSRFGVDPVADRYHSV